MRPFTYLLLQIELEGIKRISANLIACQPQNTDDCPIVISARTSDGESLVSFNEIVSEEIRSLLPKDDLKEFNTASSIKIFRQHGIQAEASHFKTYAFPTSFESTKTETVKSFGRNDPKVIVFEFNSFTDKVYTIENEEMILSACVTSRQNHKAAEA